MRTKLPTFNDRRIRKSFLWFPQTIGKECRWLEFATWEEMWHYEWRGYRWIDE